MTSWSHLLEALVLLPCIPVLFGHGGPAWYALQAGAVAIYAALAGLAGDPWLLLTAAILLAKPILLLRWATIDWAGRQGSRALAGVAAAALLLVAFIAARPLGGGLAEDTIAALATLLLGLLAAALGAVPAGLLTAELGVTLAVVLVPELPFRPLLVVATAAATALLLRLPPAPLTRGAAP